MKTPPLQTEDDLDLVKEFILLPIILDILEKDIQALASSSLKMPTIYIPILRQTQDKITADLAILRKRFRDQGLKVYEQHRTTLGVEALYLCRGYHHKFSMLWGVVKSEIIRKLANYMAVDLGVRR